MDEISSVLDASGEGGGDDFAFEEPLNAEGDPCAGKKGTLDFSKRMNNHIFPRHIATSTAPDASKYTFWPWQWTKDEYKAQVISFGQMTFEKGQGVIDTATNNIIYAYAFYGVVVGDHWAFREVGIDGLSGEATNVNTVIVRNDCKTVVTAYPGLPRQFTTIPGAIFRTGGWSTQHTSDF